VFLIAGVAMLIGWALLMADASITQWLARRSLETVSIADPPPLPRAPESMGVPRASPVRTGSAIGALSVPRVDLSAVVLHGTDARTLRRGPGHLENTALPGDAGHVVIAGHRDSFFRPLRNIQIGDDIFLDAPERRFHYRVTSLRVVPPNDVSVLAPTREATLTLITCYPFWVLGPAPDRFVVRAAAVADGAPLAPGVTPLQKSRGASRVEPQHTAGESAVLGTRAVVDDEIRVQQAVERFRLAYNARLLAYPNVRSSGPLRFEACDVTVTSDRATAVCEAIVRSPDDSPPPVRTFMLARADDGWAIKSIALK
jgi:LPXTG-site transpeptidase (sortase) family protein